MKGYQNWLDLQHYSQHLKNLWDIKNKSPKPQKYSKIRSRTVQGCRSTSYNRPSTKYPESDYLTGFETKKTQENKNSEKDQFLDLLNKKKNTFHTKTLSFQNNMLKITDFNQSSLAASATNTPKRSSSKQIRTVVFKNRDFNCPKFQQFDDTNERLQKTSSKILIENEQIFTRISSDSKKRTIATIMKTRQTIKNRESRQKQLMRYHRFSQQNILSQVHSFSVQIRVLSTSWIPNSDLLSFWIEGFTFRQNVKSPYFTYSEFVSKVIHLSFFHKPKGLIKLTIKYYRKLEEHLVGDNTLIFDSIQQGGLQKNIRIQNSVCKFDLQVNMKCISNNSSKLKKIKIKKFIQRQIKK